MYNLNLNGWQHLKWPKNNSVFKMLYSHFFLLYYSKYYCWILLIERVNTTFRKPCHFSTLLNVDLKLCIRYQDIHECFTFYQIVWECRYQDIYECFTFYQIVWEGCYQDIHECFTVYQIVLEGHATIISFKPTKCQIIFLTGT